MTVPVATIAEQALRRLGVAIVPVADRQMLNDMVPPATIAEAALRQLGVDVVPASERPALSVVVPVATIADNALRDLGVAVVPEAERPLLTVTVPISTIATSALAELGVVASDETPSAADQALALANAQEVHDSLVALGIASWPSSAIPQYASEQYTKMAANIMATSFGRAADPANYALLQERVRQAVAVVRSYDMAVATVQAVHDSLVANGSISWAATAIPRYASEEYVKMAANLMATAFGRAADPANYALLEGRVRQAVAVQRAPDLALSAVAAVQASLTSQAITWWDDSGIPGALAEEYAKMAASHLASSFGKQADPAVYTMLEQRVRRMALINSSYDQAIDAVMDVHANLVARGLSVVVTRCARRCV